MTAPVQRRPKTSRRVVNTSLSQRYVDFLRAAGDGSLAAGIVRAADALSLLERARVEVKLHDDHSPAV